LIFSVDCNDRERVRRTLMRLVDEVAMSLRKSGLSAKTVRLKLRWSDYSTITRQKTLTPPADDTDTLREASTALFVREKFPQPVRLIGFGVSRFEKPKEEQLYLFDNTNEKRKRLSQAVDEINSRFGHDSIHRG
jgi:nucleotidyltransferase/DNA polymerase involved in DNA repair